MVYQNQCLMSSCNRDLTFRSVKHIDIYLSKFASRLCYRYVDDKLALMKEKTLNHLLINLSHHFSVLPSHGKLNCMIVFHFDTVWWNENQTVHLAIVCSVNPHILTFILTLSLLILWIINLLLQRIYSWEQRNYRQIQLKDKRRKNTFLPHSKPTVFQQTYWTISSKLLLGQTLLLWRKWLDINLGNSV